MNMGHEITEIIYSVLADGEWHSLSELRCELQKRNSVFSNNENYLSVILSRLKNEENTIISDEKKRGWYRMSYITPGDDEKKQTKNYRMDVLNDWREFFSSKKKVPNYEMTEEEFKEGQWFYKLNKKIEKLIISFEEK